MDSCGRCVRRNEGDPLGYRRSTSEPTAPRGSGHLERLYGADWDRAFIAVATRLAAIGYLVAGTVLNADVVIGVPKLKTTTRSDHGQSENLVGVIGDKNWLPSLPDR